MACTTKARQALVAQVLATGVPALTAEQPKLSAWVGALPAGVKVTPDSSGRYRWPALTFPDAASAAEWLQGQFSISILY